MHERLRCAMKNDVQMKDERKREVRRNDKETGRNEKNRDAARWSKRRREEKYFRGTAKEERKWEKDGRR